MVFGFINLVKDSLGITALIRRRPLQPLPSSTFPPAPVLFEAFHAPPGRAPPEPLSSTRLRPPLFPLVHAVLVDTRLSSLSSTRLRARTPRAAATRGVRASAVSLSTSPLLIHLSKPREPARAGAASSRRTAGQPAIDGLQTCRAAGPPALGCRETSSLRQGRGTLGRVSRTGAAHIPIRVTGEANAPC